MKLRIATLGLCLCTLATGAGAHQPTQRSAAELMDVLMWNRETIGGPFALVDHHGKRRTEADFRGKLMLVYFGFTACADICPTDLVQIGLAINSLGAQGAEVVPLFITLDPQRDTTRRLAGYAPSFHPRLVALGGSAAAVRQAADAYRVYYKQIPTPGAGGYTVDHSAFIYLMDRSGGYLGFFPPGTPSSRIADVMRPYLKTPN